MHGREGPRRTGRPAAVAALVLAALAVVAVAALAGTVRAAVSPAVRTAFTGPRLDREPVPFDGVLLGVRLDRSREPDASRLGLSRGTLAGLAGAGAALAAKIARHRRRPAPLGRPVLPGLAAARVPLVPRAPPLVAPA